MLEMLAYWYSLLAAILGGEITKNSINIILTLFSAVMKPSIKGPQIDVDLFILANFQIIYFNNSRIWLDFLTSQYTNAATNALMMSPGANSKL